MLLCCASLSLSLSLSLSAIDLVYHLQQVCLVNSQVSLLRRVRSSTIVPRRVSRPFSVTAIKFKNFKKSKNQDDHDEDRHTHTLRLVFTTFSFFGSSNPFGAATRIFCAVFLVVNPQEGWLEPSIRDSNFKNPSSPASHAFIFTIRWDFGGW
jgi:hypothetical protein